MKHAGLTLVEMLVVVAIVAMIAALATVSFSTVTARQSLDKSTDAVVAVLAQARSLTVSAKDAVAYSVRLLSAGPVLFVGSTYNAGASTNKPFVLDPRLSISNISLNGAGSDVLFSKLTGTTTQSGTFRVIITGTPTSYRTVTVYATGIAEAQ
ncbi:MAG: prepilin-type N-terminal cleavage/methylation domain-containing protein [bacterium]